MIAVAGSRAGIDGTSTRPMPSWPRREAPEEPVRELRAEALRPDAVPPEEVRPEVPPDDRLDDRPDAVHVACPLPACPLPACPLTV
jgi:hypothetical protein